MNVAIVRASYVGLTTGATLTYPGHDVLCVDENPDIVRHLRLGEPTFHEPGLGELRQATRSRFFVQNRLQPSRGDQVVVNAVGTPSKHGGGADLVYVEATARGVASKIDEGAHLVVVNMSTLLVASARHVRGILQRTLAGRGVQAAVQVVLNPEFLAEGSALRDNPYLDRIFIGSGGSRAESVLRELQVPLLEQTFEPSGGSLGPSATRCRPSSRPRPPPPNSPSMPFTHSSPPWSVS